MIGPAALLEKEQISAFRKQIAYGHRHAMHTALATMLLMMWGDIPEGTGTITMGNGHSKPWGKPLPSPLHDPSLVRSVPRWSISLP